MPRLESLLNPKSIAIIGASRDKKKLGRLLLDNVLKGGFKGNVYPVNPKAGKIGGRACYSSIGEINDKIDLALIAIPAQFVYQVVKECCERKVGSIAVISSGFSEVGEEGLQQELKINRLAKDHGVNLLGPNCLGVISPFVKLNATFAKNDVIEGNVAFLSQSGALGTAALDWAQECGVGFSHFISLGNKAGLTENDFIKVLSKDDKVKAIVLYLEDFSDGRGFMDFASKTRKPIIVLKPGKSEAAQIALGSHTGSLAQDDMIISAALKHSGVVRVSTIEELFNFIKLISWSEKLGGNRLAVVTNAGGPGVITTDAIELNGLKLAKLSSRTQKLLSTKLPKASNIKNPVDVLGDALADRYKFALETVADDSGVDGIIVLLTPQVMTEIEKTALIIAEVSQSSKKLVVASFIGGIEVNKGRKILAKRRVPCFKFPVDTAKAVAHMFEHEKLETQKTKTVIYGIERNKKRAQKLLYKKSGSLDSQTAEKVLKAYKIPLLPSYFPKDIADARRIALKIKYPVVMKLVHPELLHKTEAEAVKLNIRNQLELNKAYGGLEVVGRKEKLEDFKIEMQPFVRGALELILGVKYDADQYMELNGEVVLRKKGFGHSILFGMGGIYTEVFKDVSLRMVPLTDRDIEEIIHETKVGEILEGARGVEYNLEKVKDVITKVNRLVFDFPAIRELDINPLFAKGKDVWVVDVKMILSETA